MNSRLIACLGLAAPLCFWCLYFLMSALRPDYSHYTFAISELGSLDAPNLWVWNILGYVFPGLLIAFYAFGLTRYILPEQKTYSLPGLCIALSGIFMALSGVFPGDFENRQSLTMVLHSIGAFGSYIFFLAGAFTFPALMRKSSYWKSAVTPTLICTYLTIIFGTWPFIFSNIPSIGQRFVFFFYFLWIFITAYKLLRQKEHANLSFTIKQFI